MLSASVHCIAQHSRTRASSWLGFHFPLLHRCHLTAFVIGNQLHAASYTSAGFLLRSFQTKNLHSKLCFQKLLLCCCYEGISKRWKSSSQSTSSNEMVTKSLYEETMAATWPQTNIPSSEQSIPSSSACNVRISGENPEKELVVYINDNFTTIKSVDLYSSIRKYSVDEILNLVQHSGLHLDKTHLALSLKRLFSLSVRKHASAAKFSSLHLDHRFQILAALLAKKARFLEASVAADMLTFLVHFSMKSSDLVLKVYLHVVLKNLNNLPLDQLATLAYNLGQLESTQQTRVLFEAVKILCNSRQYQLATLSVEHTIFLLSAFGAELDYVNELLKPLWNSRFDITRPRTAVAVLSAIGKTHVASSNKTNLCFRRHKSLENWCVIAAARNIDKFSVHEHQSLLVAFKHLGLYDGELFMAIGRHYSVTIDCSVADRISIWLLLVELGYLHCGLSDFILTRVHDDMLRSLSVENCISVLRIASERVYFDGGLSGNDAHVVINNSTEVILEFFNSKLIDLCQVSESQVGPDLFLETCLYMIFFGRSLPAAVVDHILENLDVYFTNESQGQSFTFADKLLLILQRINLQDSSDNRITDAISRISQKQAETSLPSSSSCLTAAFKLLRVESAQPHITPSGFFTDHLIYKSDPNDKSIAVLCWFHGMHFWRNTNRLQCIPQLYARTLQTVDNYRVVVMNADIWLTMSERERLEYLRHKVLHTASDFVTG